MSADAEMMHEEIGRLDPAVELAILARRVPKAELHLHLAGGLRPSFSRLGRPGDRPDANFDYRGASNFFGVLPEFARSMTSRSAVLEAVLRILEGCVDAGCRHVELTMQPADFDRGALSPAEVLDACAAAFAEMEARCGLGGGLIVATERSRDKDHAITTVDLALRARDAGIPVLGIGNDGAPVYPLTEYVAAYDRARAHGLRTTCHVDMADDVEAALELAPDRVEHAFDLRGLPQLRELYRERGIGVVMALTSNIVMLPGKFPSLAGHPFEELRRSGLQVCLSTDDPPMFFTDLVQEFITAQRVFGWSRETVVEIALASLDLAWFDDTGSLARWRQEAHALAADPRAPRLGSSAIGRRQLPIFPIIQLFP